MKILGIFSGLYAKSGESDCMTAVVTSISGVGEHSSPSPSILSSDGVGATAVIPEQLLGHRVAGHTLPPLQEDEAARAVLGDVDRDGRTRAIGTMPSRLIPLPKTGTQHQRAGLL